MVGQPPCGGSARAPLFCQMYRSGRARASGLLPLSGRSIAHWGEAVGQPRLSGHSTHRGAATDASRAGAREVDLMSLGGSKSSYACPLRR